MMFYSFFIIVASLVMVVWPDWRAKRVQQRIAAGDDRYFEEQRAYRAYPALSNPRHIRVIGLVGVACGLLALAMTFIRL